MSNDVTERKPVFGGRVGMVNSQQLAASMAASAKLDPRGAAADGVDYMNFSGKGGRYEVGKEKEDVDPAEVWLVNIGAFEDGWVCWKGGRSIATRLVPMGQEVPAQNTDEHGPFTKDGDGWYQAKSMTLRSIETGQQAYWKINSVSGVSVMASLQKDILARLTAGLACWPVVSLDKEKFQANGYTNWKPILKIVGWLDDTNVEKLGEVFEDEEAQIDLATMFKESAVGRDIPAETPMVEDQTETVVKRNRRTL